MRVGVNGRFYGARVTGVQRFGRELTRRLAGRVETVVLVPSGVAPCADLDAARVVRGRLGGHAWEQLELPARARTAGCDVVLHPSSTAPLWGGPHVVVVHDVTPLTHPEWFARPMALWYRVALGRGARRARRILTFSEWGRGEIVRVLRVPRERVTVVRQGLEPFHEPADAGAVAGVRERFGLPGRYLLATGAGNRRKNVAFVVRLVTEWQRRDASAPPLVVVGTGTPRVHGSRGDLRPAPGGQVRWLGYVSDSDLRALYTGATVFLFPSLGEGFGRPPLEAMGCGAPVVASNYGPARELLGDGARIVPLDVDAWIAAAATLLHDEGARAEQVRRGRSVASWYRWDDVVEEVVRDVRWA